MITTKRLILRLLSDEEMKKIIENEKDPEMITAYTEMYQYSISNPQIRQWYGIWNIELHNGKRVGDLCYKGISDEGIVEIGYGILEEYQGLGYATEAVKASVEWAKSQPNVKKIEAEAEISNIKSQNVLKKCGFTKNGIIGEEGPRYQYVGE